MKGMKAIDEEIVDESIPKRGSSDARQVQDKQVVNQ
jgi:hypothetical protein